ncbi:unknown_gene_2658 [Phodopus roborovskii]|uniref:Unknown_gene_2658 protein n=1 Tax=Phodopus roborovskii TaxID=109678 RepID=A0AAV0A6H3_PHORO|nr:unknown_gene_2658 [Phodopus roborovskii]
MRPLTEEETRVMFEKIVLVDRSDGTYCFWMHNNQVYYVSEMILKLAANISRDSMVSLGTCFGKLTKTHKFWLHVTALDYLAPYAKYKVWIKPGADNITLGFEVAANSTQDCRKVDSMAIVVFHQADIGEYVWHEESLT